MLCWGPCTPPERLTHTSPGSWLPHVPPRVLGWSWAPAICPPAVPSSKPLTELIFVPRRPTLSHQVRGALWEGVEASEEGWLGTEGGATLLETLRGKRVCQERTWTAVHFSCVSISAPQVGSRGSGRPSSCLRPGAT